MNISKKHALPQAHWFKEEFPKTLIVPHYTGGTTASGVFATWTASQKGAPMHIATSYVVDRDGTIYEFFPPEYWAYHLGLNQIQNPNWQQDKRSIGIEIVNPGQLIERAGDMFWYPNNFRTKWCSVAETDKYVRSTFRGFKAFASFPAVQMRAVAELINHLCERFKIPKTIPDAADRTKLWDARKMATFTGVATHQNFRADKLDVGPAFQWEALFPK
jgi:N-acetyl-anhydromuramyl-L-alanine amidase AmpD